MPQPAKLPEQSPETREVKQVGWREFFSAFKEDFDQGDHVSILGPTESGKTYLGLEIIECRDFAIFLATKKSDPLIEDMRRRGWRITHDLEIEERPVKRIVHGHEVVEKVPERRVVFWPKPDETKMALHDIKTYQKEQMKDALTYVYHAEGWAVFADETIWLSDKLKLRDELEHLWYQGRTSNVSLIAAAQRPAWVPRAMYSQADHIFLFQTNDHNDLERLGDIGGINIRRVQYEVMHLGHHEFLYVGTRTGVLLRSKVER